MCTGRVDPAFILRAFLNGLDGVSVTGCWPGECHYTTEGNYHALSTMLLTRKLMGYIGVNPERLRLEWVSAAEGIRFAEVMNDVSKKIKELGPLSKNEGKDGSGLKFKLRALMNLLPYIKLVERERLRVSFDKEEEYKNFFAGDEVDSLVRELIADKLAVSQMMLLLKEKPHSVGELSAILGLNPADVSRHLNRSVRQGIIKFDESQRASLSPKVRGQARG
jgi:coenzyme F420-reducing hydrogenase delta subunit